MRLAYILAVIIAATLYSGGSALTATNSNRAMISNADTVYPLDGTQESGGRALRKRDPVSAEGRIGEERSFKDILKYLQKSITKRIPFTDANRVHRATKKLEREAKQWERMQSNIRYASG